MSVKIYGKIHKVLPLTTGEGKNGTWKKQEFILETNEQYPKQICIAAWGDKIDETIIKPGNTVTVSVDIESREYNGRWYTDLKAWKFELQNPSAPTHVAASDPGLPPHLQPDFDEGEMPF